MKIKLYNPSELNGQPRNIPAIRIALKSGVFFINDGAALKLKLKEKDRICMGNDPDFPTEWVVRKTTNPDSFEMRSTGNGMITFNSTALAKIIFSTLNTNGKNSIKLLLASEPLKDDFWPLITAPYKKANK